MKEPHDFNESLENAKPWEEKLKEKIVDFMIKHKIRRVEYDTRENIKLQKNGIDLVVTSERGDWEAKIRSNKYYGNDILLETVSVVEDNKPGWVYTCLADVIVYCWKNTSETNLMRRGYLILIKQLRKTNWFKKLEENYPIKYTKSKRDNTEWTTQFVTPPVKDFPKGTIYPFNPYLKNTNITQSLIEVVEGSTPLSLFNVRGGAGT